MEWVETTGKSLDEAKDEALDRLGIVAEDAEFEVLEEPRTGLFGRTRGVAVRARVRPAAVRPKQDRRGRRRTDGRSEAAVRPVRASRGACSRRQRRRTPRYRVVGEPARHKPTPARVLAPASGERGHAGRAD